MSGWGASFRRPAACSGEARPRRVTRTRAHGSGVVHRCVSRCGARLSSPGIASMRCTPRPRKWTPQRHVITQGAPPEQPHHRPGGLAQRVCAAPEPRAARANRQKLPAGACARAHALFAVVGGRGGGGGVCMGSWWCVVCVCVCGGGGAKRQAATASALSRWEVRGLATQRVGCVGRAARTQQPQALPRMNSDSQRLTRNPPSPVACAQERQLPGFLDLVVWGHEHECIGALQVRRGAALRGAAWRGATVCAAGLLCGALHTLWLRAPTLNRQQCVCDRSSWLRALWGTSHNRTCSRRTPPPTGRCRCCSRAPPLRLRCQKVRASIAREGCGWRLCCASNRCQPVGERHCAAVLR
jgi:hypothetical protein